MSRRLVSTSSVLVLALAACAPQPDLAVEEQAIRDISASWMAMDEAKDAAGIASLFADDAGVYWEQRAPARGSAAILAHMQRAQDENPSGEGGFGSDRIDIAASADLAVEQGAYENPADQGRYITVHKKVGDEWKVLADMSVSMAPDGGAPDWAVKSLSDWYAAYNARDASTIATLYARNARVGGAQGRNAIIANFRAGWAETADTCSGAYDGFEIVDDIAAGWGRDVCTLAGATTLSRWLTFHERQPDGSWLMIRDRGQPIE